MTDAALITLPTSSCMATISLGMTRVIARTNSPFTLEEQSFQWPGEQWDLSFNLPPIVDRAIAAEWRAFGMAMKGSFNYVLLGDPLGATPRGVATGTPQVRSAGQEGNTLESKGWTPNVTGILLKGDYIQYGTGALSRLHMLVEDADSDASGFADLVLEPALRYSPTLNSAIVVTNARGVFRLASNAFKWHARPGPIYDISFDAVEVINA